jgi:2,4-diaminopentanoate dehydrogenase
VTGAVHRVVLWGTGNVGRHAIAGIDARPDLELVGVWVSNPDKVGRDAGELAGLGRTLGVRATGERSAVLELAPDCVVHAATARCSVNSPRAWCLRR